MLPGRFLSAGCRTAAHRSKNCLFLCFLSKVYKKEHKKPAIQPLKKSD